MNLLAPFITLDNIQLDIEVSSRKRLFEEASLMFEHAYGISHTRSFEALIAREKLGSTCVGAGCAIPHGRLKNLDKTLIVLLRTKEPVALPTPDGKDVQLFLCLLIARQDNDTYLALLRECAAFLQNRNMRQALLEAQTPLDVCQIIHNWIPPEGLHLDLSFEDQSFSQ